MTHNHPAPLLVELLTEELPPKALARLGDAFAEGVAQRLAARDLAWIPPGVRHRIANRDVSTVRFGDIVGSPSAGPIAWEQTLAPVA